MRNIILALTLAAFVLAPFNLEADAPILKEAIPQQVSPEVMKELNKPLPKTEKVTTGGWIWIGVFILAAVTFGSLAYSTKRPISADGK
jgi:hypothetical protein